MATSNARIQFSTADEETWKSVNPMLREGELVIAKKPSGKYRLYVGAKGGSKFKDSTVVWDEELADSHEKNAAISADAAMTSKLAAASSASYAAQSMNSAKESASAAEQSMNSAEASADQAAEYMNNAINSSSAAAQNSASAASSMKKAEQSMNSAKESADKAVAASNNASSSASSAANSESNAIDAKNKATQSASEAKSSELNAKASEKSAANSAAALSYATQEEVNFGIESRKIVSPKTLGTLLNLLQRNTSYRVGEIVYSTKLPSWAYLECTQAGTTGNSEPNLSTISGGEVNDGSVKWTVKTVTGKEYVDEKTKNNKDYIDTKINNCEQKKTVKTINVNVESQYVENMSCIQIGHVVQVSFDLKKSDESRGTALIASGLPHAVVDFIFSEVIHGDEGGSVRFKMMENGELRFHYPLLYTATLGHEFATEFTYLTND